MSTKHSAILSPPMIDSDPPEVIAAKQQKAADAQPAQDEPVGIDFTFHVKMFSRFLGKELDGVFTNTIMTPAMEIHRGTIRSQMLVACSGNIDVQTRYRAEVIAHLIVSLKKKPDWFDPRTFEDRQYMDAVYKEVDSHESRFWGEDDEEG